MPIVVDLLVVHTLRHIDDGGLTIRHHADEQDLAGTRDPLQIRRVRGTDRPILSGAGTRTGELHLLGDPLARLAAISDEVLEAPIESAGGGDHLAVLAHRRSAPTRTLFGSAGRPVQGIRHISGIALLAGIHVPVVAGWGSHAGSRVEGAGRAAEAAGVALSQDSRAVGAVQVAAVAVLARIDRVVPTALATVSRAVTAGVGSVAHEIPTDWWGNACAGVKGLAVPGAAEGAGVSRAHDAGAGVATEVRPARVADFTITDLDGAVSTAATAIGGTGLARFSIVASGIGARARQRAGRVVPHAGTRSARKRASGEPTRDGRAGLSVQGVGCVCIAVFRARDERIVARRVQL